MIDKDIQIRTKNILVWCSEYIEANAELLKESSTEVNGNWRDDDDKQQYAFEMGKVFEMDDLLKHISADLHEDK